MSWLGNILSPVRRLIPGAATTDAQPRRARVASYHLGRRLIESLEPRQMLSDATFGGLTFHQDTANGTKDTQLTDLFAHGSAAAATRVEFVGSLQAGGQTLAGDFTVTATASTSTFTVSATGLTVALPNNLAKVTNGQATLTLNGSGISGMISNGGSFALNAGGLSVNVTSVSFNWATSGGDTNILLGVSGSLNIAAGQSFSNGTFTFERNNSDVAIGVSGVNVNLGGGLVNISNLHGSLDLSTSGVTGSGSVGASGSFTSGSATFSGVFGFAIDTTATDKSLQVTGTGVNVTIGLAQVTADFKFEEISGHATSVGASVTNLTADFSDGTNHFVHLASPASGSNATAAFLFEGTGIAGVIDGTATVAAPGGVSASGEAVLMLNSSTSDSSFPDPIHSGQSIDVPAGPLLEVYLRNTQLNLSASLHVTGSFGFSLAHDSSNNTVTTVTADAASGTFGAASISAASGTLTLSSGGGSGHGLSGTLTGSASLGGGGSSVSGAISVTFDANGYHLGGSNVSIAVLGQTITGSFTIDASGGSTTFTITNASLLFGNGLLTADHLTGSFTIDGSNNAAGTVSGVLATTIGGAAIAGGISVVFGASAMTLAGTSDTVTVGDQSVSGDFSVSQSGSGAGTTVSVAATGVNALLGPGGLVRVTNASFNLSLSQGQFTGSASGTVAAGDAEHGVAFSGPLAVTVTSTAVTAATPSGQTDTFTVAGQVFVAGFTFSEDAAGLEMGISGVNLSLAGGALSISNASGTLLVRSDGTGVDGSFAAAFSSNVASLSGNVQVGFGGGSVTISATGLSLSIGGESISGSATITTQGNEIDFAATGLTASLAGGLVTIQPPPSGAGAPASTLKILNGQLERHVQRPGDGGERGERRLRRVGDGHG